MPHEVIMPALGMAQDSGVLVAWLKSPGEPVKVGDGLMEIETDKATMEVEAQADGFLTDIRVQAGDSAPVGGVVATISETPDGNGEAGDGAASPAPVPAKAAAPAVEGHPVIMPALGMAQDSGVVVSWAKAIGDAVADDETLFEVETDKATMEAPAGAAGFLAARYAEAGDSVPVGEVIALITPEKPAAGAPQPPKPGAAPDGPVPAPAPEAKAPVEAAPTIPAAPPLPAEGGRVLASPKARRLAAARGIDLRRLLEAGAAQPIRAADLDRFADATRAAPTAAPKVGPTAQHASAEVAAAPLAAFLDWLAAETGDSTRRGPALAAFAAAAFREATGCESVGLALGPTPRAPERRFADPDRAPLGEIAETEARVDLRLRDLGATAITGLRLGCDGPPTLSLSTAGDRVRIDYEGVLPPDEALALLDGFAARLADPIRHLL